MGEDNKATDLNGENRPKRVREHLAQDRPDILFTAKKMASFYVSTDRGVGNDKAPWKIFCGQAENCDAVAG